METSKISLKARATGEDLDFLVRIDGQEIYRRHDLSRDFETVVFDFDDSQELEHVLEFEMSGKTVEHTKLDENGKIIQDRVIEISDITMDDFCVGNIFFDQAEYHNDRNGTSDHKIDQFFGIMGCNGIVRLRFTSPLYLWLLENI